MIEDHVHHSLYPVVMKFLHERGILTVASETGIDLVIIGSGITVIAATFHIVLKNRIQPHGGYAERIEIIDMTGDSGKVSAVTGVGIITVYLHMMTQFRHIVYAFIAAGEPVGHNHIQHISGGKSFRTFLSLAGAQFEFFYNLAFTLAPFEFHDPRLSFGRYGKVYILPVRRAVESDNRINGNSGIGQ